MENMENYEYVENNEPEQLEAIDIPPINWEEGMK